MADPETSEELARYLRQRLEAGERERLVVPSARPPAALPADTTSATPSDEVPAPPAAAPAAAAAAAPASDTAAARADALSHLAAEVAACTRCRLHATRTHTVPGVGSANAGVVFVGEAPGADEDAQGEPFVGAAGQLLNKILAAIGFRREEVFITNILKCRPPGNRDPQPDEVACCRPYLERQLAILRPKVICALGRHAGSTLTGAPDNMTALRSGTWHYQGIRVFPTYHPAALLRNSNWKRPTWEDVQALRAEHDRLSGHP